MFRIHKRKQNQVIDDLEEELEQHQRLLNARDTELEKVKHEKAEAVRNFEKCKDQIFNMQPVEGIAGQPADRSVCQLVQQHRILG